MNEIRRRTRKTICPVCKKDAYLAIGEVCGDCSYEIETLRRFHKDHQDRTRAPFSIPERYYDLPHISTHDSILRERPRASDRINTLVHDLALLVSEAGESRRETKSVWDYSGQSDFGRYYNQARLFDPRVAKALGELQSEVRKALAEEYRLGIQHGKDVLTQLALGEITVDQFSSIGQPKEER